MSVMGTRVELVQEAHDALVAELGVRAAGHTGMDKCGISMLRVAYVQLRVANPPFATIGQQEMEQ